MTDQEKRDKVIKGLEHEIARTKVADTEWLDCVEVALLRNALTLLKAQEPRAIQSITAPLNPNAPWRGRCPKCRREIVGRNFTNFCKHCGQAVKWE